MFQIADIDIAIFTKCISSENKKGNIRIAVEVNGEVTDDELAALNVLHKKMSAKAKEIIEKRGEQK